MSTFIASASQEHLVLLRRLEKSSLEIQRVVDRTERAASKLLVASAVVIPVRLAFREAFPRDAWDSAELVVDCALLLTHSNAQPMAPPCAAVTHTHCIRFRRGLLWRRRLLGGDVVTQQRTNGMNRTPQPVCA